MRDYAAIAEKKEKDWAVIAQYDHANYIAGDVISVHRTYDRAIKAARREYPTFRSVRNLRD
jgi:hypothetical protein